jgi:hypothetical protein
MKLPSSMRSPVVLRVVVPAQVGWGCGSHCRFDPDEVSKWFQSVLAAVVCVKAGVALPVGIRAPRVGYPKMLLPRNWRTRKSVSNEAFVM